MNGNKLFLTIERSERFANAIYCDSYRITSNDTGKVLTAWVIDPNGCMCMMEYPVYYTDTISCEYVRG